MSKDLPQSTPYGVNTRVAALVRLLGAKLEQTKELAELASPVFHVDKNDPPIRLLHGDQEPQLPIQSHELQGAYEKLGLDAHLDVVQGAAHGGPAFWEPMHVTPVLDF